MPILRVTAVGTGWTGAPGASQFHWLVAAGSYATVSQDCYDAVGDFYNALTGKMPQGVSWQPQTPAQIYNEDDGALLDEENISVTTDPIAGTDTGTQLSRATMMKCKWSTTTIINGRKVRGGIFFGPVGSSALTTDGAVSSQAVSALATAHAFLTGVANAQLVVWHRPVNGVGGVGAPVTATSVSALPAVLRSRRD